MGMRNKAANLRLLPTEKLLTFFNHNEALNRKILQEP